MLLGSYKKVFRDVQRALALSFFNIKPKCIVIMTRRADTARLTKIIWNPGLKERQQHPPSLPPCRLASPIYLTSLTIWALKML